MSERIKEVVSVKRVSDHPRQRLLDFSPSRTKEAPAAATDVNAIMARYAKTGVVPVTRMQAAYGDVSALSGFDYGQAIENLQKLNESFMELPAKVRERFSNDPGQFLAFVQSGSKEEAIELGLIEAEKEVEVK